MHVLTSGDIQSGRYSIRDVVLPLPGIDTIFPGNKVADWLQELLSLAGITLGSFRSVHKGRYVASFPGL